jgi:hypothetical protein
MPLAFYPFQRAREAFLAEYALLDELAASLADEQLLLASRCRGWAVCDVLCHLHLGLEEVLVGFASPTDRQADTDFASYWRDCCADDDLDLGHARFVRLVASAYARPGGLVARLRKAMGAALRLAERAADDDGRQVPVAWDDATYAMKGTGRLPLTGEERQALGPLSDRFPLFA